MVYIILALLLYTVAIMFGTLASRNAETNLVSAIMNILSAIIPIAVVIPILNNKLLVNSKFGILMAVVAGIAIALFTLALNKGYATNKVACCPNRVWGGNFSLCNS